LYEIKVTLIECKDGLHLLCSDTSCSPTYNVTVTQVRVGTTLIDVEFTALFDSGTSFTYLVAPTYTRLTESVST